METDETAAARAKARAHTEAMAQPLTEAQRADREVRAGAVKLLRQMAAMDATERQLFKAARERVDRANAAVPPSRRDDPDRGGGRDID